MKGKVKTYFTCPTDLIASKSELYLGLVKHIKAKSLKITYDWVEDALKDINSANSGIDKRKDVLDYHRLKIEGVGEADLVIAEMSKKSIGVINQITIALQKSKPVLLLLPFSKNEWEIRAIKSPWFIQKQYKDIDEARLHISNFIETYSDHKKTRINLVISSFENDFLVSEMRKHNKSKTSIIRDLIKREADKI